MTTVKNLIKALEILVPDPVKRDSEFIQAGHGLLWLPVDPGPEPADYKGWNWQLDGLLADGRAVRERTEWDDPETPDEELDAFLKDCPACRYSGEYDCWAMNA